MFNHPLLYHPSVYHSQPSNADSAFDAAMDTTTEAVPLNRYTSLAAAAAAVSAKHQPMFDGAYDSMNSANSMNSVNSAFTISDVTNTANASGSYFPLLSVPGEEPLPPAAFNPLSVNFTPASSPLAATNASTPQSQSQTVPYLNSLASLAVNTPFSPHAATVKAEINTATAPLPPASAMWTAAAAYNQFYNQTAAPAPAIKHEFNPLPLSVDYLLAGSNASLLPIPNINIPNYDSGAAAAVDMSSPASYAMSPASPLAPTQFQLQQPAAPRPNKPVAIISRPPARTAKSKATDTIHQIATARSDDDDSDQSDESPQHKSMAIAASRKRKSNDDDSEFEAIPSSEDSSIGSGSEIDEKAEDDTSDADYAATARKPVKRAKVSATKRVAAYTPSAASGGTGTAVVPLSLPAQTSEITAPYIRAQLVAQVKALQQRINSGAATDPRTELEALKDVLSEFQFSSCSGTMAIYGLSFPHAASAIPAPVINKPTTAAAVTTVAVAAAAAPTTIKTHKPHKSISAQAMSLYHLPPVQSDSFAFPMFDANSYAPSAIAVSAPVVAAGGGGGSEIGATSGGLELHTFELMRTVHGSQMVFIQCQVSPSETIRFQLKINKHLISRAPTSAYFEGKSFVVPSIVADSLHQIRVSQVHRGTTQPILCVVGGEVRHAKLKSKAELAKIAASGAAAHAHDLDDGDDEPDVNPNAGHSAAAEAKQKRRISAAKKDKDSNNGRPLKCNIICQAGIPIRFSVYGKAGFVPQMWASTKLRKLSDSRLIATNDDFKFKLIKS